MQKFLVEKRTTTNAEKSILAPSRTPAVFDNPVVFFGFCIGAVSDQKNGVIS